MSLSTLGILFLMAIGPCSAQPRNFSLHLSEQELLEKVKIAKTPQEKAFSSLQLAEKYRLNNKSQEAKNLFEKTGRISSKYTAAVDVGLALIYAKKSNESKAFQTLERYMDNNRVLSTQKGSLYAALARNAYEQQDAESAAYYQEQALALSTEHNKLAIQEELAAYQTGSIEEPTDTSSTSTPSTSSGSDATVEKLRELMRENLLEQASTLIDNISTEQLEEGSLLYIEASKKRIAAEDPFFADKIGILLPISHEKYAPAAKAFQSSIEYVNQQLAIPFQLHFFDTKGDPEEAKTGVEELVLQEGCAILLGPMLKTTVSEAAQRAQEFEIPMLTLSKENTPVKKGDFIFYVNLSPEQQISALIKHSITERELTRFTFLAPDIEYYRLMSMFFEEEVLRMNGTFVRSQFYDPETTDFRATARIFSDKDNIPDRSKYTDNYPPRSDFDILFIPDNFRKTPLLVAALASEGYKVGTFSAGHDIPKTHLIGLNNWNNPTIIRSSGQYMIGSLFMDAIWMRSEEEQQVLFRENFRSELKRKPNIFDAILFDSLQFAALAHKSTSRYEVQQNLQNQPISVALTGGLQFNEKREIDRSLLLLELKRNGIHPWVAEEK